MNSWKSSKVRHIVYAEQECYIYKATCWYVAVSKEECFTRTLSPLIYLDGATGLSWSSSDLSVCPYFLHPIDCHVSHSVSLILVHPIYDNL
jgi:hypothetical protein